VRTYRDDQRGALRGRQTAFVVELDGLHTVHLGDIGHPAVQEKLAFAAAECSRLGKPCGIVGGTPDMVAKFLAYGYSWVAVASDMAMMMGRAQEFLAKVRGVATSAATSGNY